jgi:hypothetical protein
MRRLVFGRTYGIQPNELPNLAVWLKADSGVTVTGSGVSQWNDLSGNGRHFTQSTDSKRPPLVNGVLNGFPVLRFDGTSQELAGNTATLNTYNNKSGGSIFTVVRDVNPSGGNTVHFVLVFTNNAGSARATITTRNSSNIFQAGSRRLDSDTFRSSDFSPSNSNWNILNGQFNWAGNQLQLFVNNSGQAINTYSSGGGNTSATNSLSASIGNGANNFLSGDIAEIICYDRHLNATERDSIYLYLKNKYNL